MESERQRVVARHPGGGGGTNKRNKTKARSHERDRAFEERHAGKEGITEGRRATPSALNREASPRFPHSELEPPFLPLSRNEEFSREA